MVNTRSTDRDSASSPILGQGSTVTTTIAPTAPTVTTATYAFPTSVITTVAASSSTAPPIPSCFRDGTHSLNPSFWSHGSVPSPEYSMLTGLQQQPPIRTREPAVSTGVREIINTAVDLVRRQFRQEEEERMRVWIPQNVEATRRSLGVYGEQPPATVHPACCGLPPANGPTQVRLPMDVGFPPTRRLASDSVVQQPVPNTATSYSPYQPEQMPPNYSQTPLRSHPTIPSVYSAGIVPPQPPLFGNTIPAGLLAQPPPPVPHFPSIHQLIEGFHSRHDRSVLCSQKLTTVPSVEF